MRFFSRAGDPHVTRSPIASDEALPVESGDEDWIRRSFLLPPAVKGAAAAGLPLNATPGALILRPVHLHVGLDHLVLDPPEHLGLTEPHAQALFSAAADWLAAEPISLRYLSAQLWELTESRPETTHFAELHVASSARASGRNIDLWLPRGQSARAWRRLMNEVQMLWHMHPVNAEREASGLKPVNALWLEGVVPEALPPVFNTVMSSDPVLTGLAMASGATVLPDVTHPAKMSLLTHQNCLIDAPFWRQAITSGSDRAWEDGWQAFENWFLGMSAQHGNNWLAGALLVLTGETSAHLLRLPRRPSWRLWRRSAPAVWFEESPLVAEIS